MINPLEQFVAVDERPDGVYVKITRADKPSVRMDLIKTAITNALVMNFDQQKFEDILMRARGAFERIGPVFEYFNTEMEKYLQLTITSQRAVLKVNSGCLALGKKPNERTLAFFLHTRGVTHGVNIEKLRQIIDSNLWDEFHEVAQATLPEKGTDGKIEMLISIDPNMQPHIRGDGTVDYRDIQSFVSVSRGQVLAVRHPPSSGKSGIGLGGEEIPAAPGADHKLPNGKNTEISSDGIQLIASKTGIVYTEGLLIHIAEMLHISGNIDFNVGNVKYSGDVMVNGNVCAGFSVEADGNIHIKGEIESARIVSRNGNVVIEKGILGKGDTMIKAKNGIIVSFAQEAQLVTDGIITFEKFLLHCECTCEAIDGQGQSASIIGGHVNAEKYVNVKQIGTDKGALTKVTLFDKNRLLIEVKIKELLILDKKLKTELEPIEKQIRTKAALLKRSDDVTSRQKDEVKKWIDAYNLLTQKIKYVAEKTDELKKELDSPGQYDGFIFIQGMIYAGTEFDIYKIRHTVTENLTNKRFRIIQSGIQAGE